MKPLRLIRLALLALGLSACGGGFANANPQAERERAGVSSETLRIASPLLAQCGVTSRHAFFETDSAALSDAGKVTLKSIAECVTKGPLKGRGLAVHGYADPRGSAMANLALGAERAMAVADFLTQHGVPQAQMTLLSHGEEEAEGSEPLGYTYDRRVRIELLPPASGDRAATL